jgi:hypothetical protein
MRLDPRPWFEVWEALLAWANSSAPSAFDPVARQMARAIRQAARRQETPQLSQVRQGFKRWRK